MIDNSQLQIAFAYLVLATILLSASGMAVLSPKIVAKNKTQLTVSNCFIAVILVAISWLAANVLSQSGIGKGWFLITYFVGGVTILYWIYTIVRNASNKGALILFFVYLIALMYITFFSRIGAENNTIKMSLGHFFESFVSKDSSGEVRHFILNVIMFVPLGVIIPFINSDKFAKISSFIPGIIISLLIEGTQLLLSKGECDISDIIGNSLGMLIGVIVGILITKNTKIFSK